MFRCHKSHKIFHNLQITKLQSLLKEHKYVLMNIMEILNVSNLQENKQKNKQKKENSIAW